MNRRLLSFLPLALASFLSAQDPEPVPPQEPTPPQQPERPFALMVGDPAPALAVAEWVKGDGVTAFQPDKVYVVEFWATWCGPCIYGMPHLSEVQEEYAAKGVRVLGINIWDEAANVRPFLKSPIPMHDDKTGDEVMRYTIGIERQKDGEGIMAAQWMAAAGQNGIPCAFVIDQKGRVAWIGHPMELDEPLAKIVAGDWDIAGEAKAYAARMAEEAKIEKYFELFGNKEFEKAYAIGRELMKGPAAENPGLLNALAWGIVDPNDPPAKQDLDLALAAAKKAAELTENQDASILDTLATVHYARRELEEAVRLQRKAAELADDDDLGNDIRARLKMFEKALEDQRRGGGEKKQSQG
ncbi:MAG: redoxin family protein [Planctomycetes bacterium]|nr:redoxin family protein [Planctomycetota bacterium]